MPESATGDGEVPMLASRPSPASDSADDELLDHGEKRGESSALLPPTLAGPGSTLAYFCGA